MVDHTVEIIEMGWKNFRDFEDVVLDLAPVNADGSRVPKPNSLVQIQNGYGKTSTMWAIRSALSNMKLGDFGEGLEGSKAEIRQSYRYRYPSSFGWGGDPKEDVQFQMVLKIDGELIYHGFTINPATGEQKFWTSQVNDGGKQDTYSLPGWFRDMFGTNNELLSLYVFDGELARELVDGTGASNLWIALQKIAGIHGVSLLIAPGGQLTSVMDILKSEGGTKNKDVALDKLSNLVKARIAVLKGEAKRYEEKLLTQKTALTQNQAAVKSLIKELGDSSPILKQRRKELDKAKKLLDEEIRNVTRDSVDPTKLLTFKGWSEIVEFYTKQHRAKLPKGVAKNFFDDILKDSRCICGTSWSKDMKMHLANNREHYLVAGLMTRVMNIQTEVRDMIHSGNDRPAKDYCDRLMDAKEKFEQIEREHNKALADFDQEKHNSLQELNQATIDLQNEARSTEMLLDEIVSNQRNFILEYNLDDPLRNKNGEYRFSNVRVDLVQNIHCLEEFSKAIALKLGKASEHAHEFRGAEVIDLVLAEAMHHLEKRQQKRLLAGMNEFTEKWPGFRMKIGFQKNKIRFYDLNGKLQTKINESAKLAALYGLVASLNQYASVDFPLVIDTPFAGFGSGMVREWADAVPQSFHQTLSLINSLEKRGLQNTEYCGKEPHPSSSYFTFHRADEDLRTGTNKIGIPTPDPQLKTSGKMLVSPNYADFVMYEGDV